MKHEEQNLVRHLAIAIVIKIMLLIALWFIFIRDARVHLDADQVVQKFSQAAQNKEDKK